MRMKEKTGRKFDIRPVTTEEFLEYSSHGHERYIESLVASSGKTCSIIRETVGPSPKNPHKDDLWLVVENDDENLGYVWIRVFPEKFEAFGYDIYLRP